MSLHAFDIRDLLLNVLMNHSGQCLVVSQSFELDAVALQNSISLEKLEVLRINSDLGQERSGATIPVFVLNCLLLLLLNRLSSQIKHALPLDMEPPLDDRLRDLIHSGKVLAVGHVAISHLRCPLRANLNNLILPIIR